MAREEEVELSAFGVTAVEPVILPLLLGVGLRRILAAPAELRDVRRTVSEVELEAAAAAAQRAAGGSCSADAMSLVAGFRHGYAPS